MLGNHKTEANAGIVLVSVASYLGLSEFISLTIDRGILGSVLLDTAMGAICSVIYFRYRRHPERDCESGRVWALYASGFVYWFCVSFVISYFQREAGQWPVDIMGGLSGANRAMYAFIALIAAPWFEEMFFRGILFDWLRGKMFWPFASLIASLVFSYVHGSSAQVYGAFILGLFLCLLYHATGNIGWNILFHSLYNMGMLFVQPLLPVPESMGTHHAMYIGISVALSLYTTVLFGAVVHINESEHSM